MDVLNIIKPTTMANPNPITVPKAIVEAFSLILVKVKITSSSPSLKTDKNASKNKPNAVDFLSTLSFKDDAIFLF